ncbi:MAG: recombinase family protein, partial [Ktedonobacteraceae bacterium]
MAYQSEYEKYRGKRALMLLRVSTKEQEKGFGWAAQEMEIRKHLIDPLELVLNNDTHILRDTYTGLEFKERPVLDRILELAQERTFDVLVTDVLDRLGRQGLPRE